MSIQSEEMYLKIIDRIIESIGSLQTPLKSKISAIWKQKLCARIRKNFISLGAKKQKKKTKGESDDSLDVSDDELLLPDTQNVCFGILQKIIRKEPVWRLKIAGCTLKLEDGSEHVLQNAHVFIKDTF
jgi:hypothetical protein